jgi:hypothetical protein
MWIARLYKKHEPILKEIGLGIMIILLWVGILGKNSKGIETGIFALLISSIIPSLILFTTFFYLAQAELGAIFALIKKMVFITCCILIFGGLSFLISSVGTSHLGIANKYYFLPWLIGILGVPFAALVLKIFSEPELMIDLWFDEKAGVRQKGKYTEYMLCVSNFSKWTTARNCELRISFPGLKKAKGNIKEEKQALLKNQTEFYPIQDANILWETQPNDDQIWKLNIPPWTRNYAIVLVEQNNRFYIKSEQRKNPRVVLNAEGEYPIRVGVYGENFSPIIRNSTLKHI